MGLIYKIARTKSEIEQIHRLNYRTFVEEIPQHPISIDQLRIDVFHDENTYLICLKDKKLIGMLAVRNKRPFSLDKKIGQVEKQLPIEAKSLCEIRLLAVDREHRGGRVFLGLSKLLAHYCLKQNYDVAVISGTTMQTKLYNQLGFKPFSNPIGTLEAQFQPMFMTKEVFKSFVVERVGSISYSYLPGPVMVAKEVMEALMKPPVSHRTKKFTELISSVKEKLLLLSSAKNCQLMFGTGTLANEVIAMQLRKHGKGLVFISGEFGQRLKRHADRAGLDFITHEIPWGRPFPQDEVRSILLENHCEWIWLTHCETSTGILHSLDDIKEVCRGTDVKICLDAISSLGSFPVNLSEVYLASGVSGKAICSYSGLSFVFHQEDVEDDPTIPAYLDLGNYIKNNSVPFTQSSNMMEALNTSLSQIVFEPNSTHFKRIKEHNQFIRDYLMQKKIPVLADQTHACPVILTIPLPLKISSTKIGEDMELAGYQLHYESNYLIEKNWIQISPISNISLKETENMLKKFVALIEYNS